MGGQRAELKRKRKVEVVGSLGVEIGPGVQIGVQASRKACPLARCPGVQKSMPMGPGVQIGVQASMLVSRRRENKSICKFSVQVSI